MKRLLIFVVVVLVFVGCNNVFEDERNLNLAGSGLPTFTVGFEETTRTYVYEGFYLRWHSEDNISVFHNSTVNSKYVFTGETGDNRGEVVPVEGESVGTGNSLDRSYAIYPYDSATTISDEGVIYYTLPSNKVYDVNSFGKEANAMVAVTEGVNDESLMFKNIGGYLKIKLYGTGIVKSVELRGNRGEKIAGKVAITANYDDAPVVFMSDAAADSILLDVAGSVSLNSKADNASEFWFVIPPMTFESGITITVSDIVGNVIEKSTNEPIVIERNTIQPMAAVAVEFDYKPTSCEIFYTSSNGEIVKPLFGKFGANIVSNVYKDGRGIITFDGNVTTIGTNEFASRGNLTSVTIPDSVTTIEYAAFFNCASLMSVTIPDGVTTIGNFAFKDCDSLTSVTIPDSVTTIEGNPFANCTSLKEIKGRFASEFGRCLIVDGVFHSIAIGSSVMKNYTIPDGVTAIGEGLFYYCDSLTSVTIPDSVTTIGVEAFGRCSGLKEFKGKFVSNDGRCLVMDNTIIAYASDSGSEYSIPNDVTTIGDSAFRDKSSLTSVTIPDSVTVIEANAFRNSTKLQNVYCMATEPPLLGDYVFYVCNSLAKIYVPAESLASYMVADGWEEFYDIIIGYDFDEGEVDPDAQKASMIKYTTSDGNIINVDSSYFDANIVSNVYKNGEGVITFDDLLTEIRYDAFISTNLTSITIPDSVTKVEDGAFRYCYAMEEFKGKFASDDGRCLIVDGELKYFAVACSETYYSIPNGVTTIGMGAFADADNLEIISIPNSVITIDQFAFVGCGNLSDIYWGSNITLINYNAFTNCDSLQEVVIPDSVTDIGLAVFAGCTNLQTVVIPAGITEIDMMAFKDCKNLVELYCKAVYPPQIGENAFYGANIRLVVVPMGSEDMYRAAWPDYDDYIVGYYFY